MDDLTTTLDELAELIARIDRTDPRAAVQDLRVAETLVNKAFSEAMAQSALLGTSLRQLAADARLAPNTVAARLSQAPTFRAYAPAGRVTAEDLAVERRSKAGP
ncbi:hypothetical protein [Mariniluteicoccus flavus]